MRNDMTRVPREILGSSMAATVAIVTDGTPLARSRRTLFSVTTLLAVTLTLSSCGLAELIAGPPSKSNPTPSPSPTTPSATTPPLTPTAFGPWRNISPTIDLTLFGRDQFGFQTIGLSPANPNVLYLGTCYEGIWKSTNQGASWSHVSSGINGANLSTGRNWTLAVDPTNAEIVYTVAGYGNGQGLWKSTNGGVDWTQMLPPTVMSAATADIYNVSIDPADHNHLLLGSHSGWNGTENAGVLESKDGGVSWILHTPQLAWGKGHYLKNDILI